MGATVHTSDGATYTTPAKITLKRNKDHVLAVTLAGHQTQQVALSSVLSGAMFGNILLGGIIGGIVDASSGAAWKLEPEAVAITMQPLTPGQTAAAPTFAPLTPEQRLANLEALKKSGNISNEDYEATKKVFEAEIKKNSP